MRDFSSRQVTTVLFDCPLWPAADEEPHVLVSYMTGLVKPAHTVFAHELCKRALANQFPTLAMWSGSHLEVGTLHRHLALHAELRKEDLHQWLDELQDMARIDVHSYQQDTELLYAWADKLDWHLVMDQDRSAALHSWFVSLSRYLIQAPVNIDERTLKMLLRKLNTRFRLREEQARETHSTWLETRRCIAYLHDRVAVQPLPANTYTEQTFLADQQRLSKHEGLHQERCAWGRLDYFRSAVQTQTDFA